MDGLAGEYLTDYYSKQLKTPRVERRDVAPGDLTLFMYEGEN